MTTRQPRPTARVERPVRRRAWRTPLAREIALALLIKLVLLMGIRSLFFSHPIGKQEVARRLEQMIDGGSKAASNAPHSLNGTEQK